MWTSSWAPLGSQISAARGPVSARAGHADRSSIPGRCKIDSQQRKRRASRQEAQICCEISPEHPRGQAVAGPDERVRFCLIAILILRVRSITATGAWRPFKLLVKRTARKRREL